MQYVSHPYGITDVTRNCFQYNVCVSLKQSQKMWHDPYILRFVGGGNQQLIHEHLCVFLQILLKRCPLCHQQTLVCVINFSTTGATRCSEARAVKHLCRVVVGSGVTLPGLGLHHQSFLLSKQCLLEALGKHQSFPNSAPRKCAVR